MSINGFDKNSRNSMVDRISEKRKLQEMYLSEAVTLGDVAEAYTKYKEVKADPKASEEDVRKAKGHMYYLSRKYKQYRESLGKKEETEVEKKIDNVLKEQAIILSEKEWRKLDDMSDDEKRDELSELKEILSRSSSDEYPAMAYASFEKRAQDLEGSLGEYSEVSLKLAEGKEEDTMTIVTEEKKDNFDYCYGIPSQKKYPLYDEKHVRSAIRLFGHVEPRFEKELARAIIAKMKKFGIPYSFIGEDNRLHQYLPKGAIVESVSYDEILDEDYSDEEIEIIEMCALYESLNDILNTNLIQEGKFWNAVKGVAKTAGTWIADKATKVGGAIKNGAKIALNAVGGVPGAVAIGAGAAALAGAGAIIHHHRKKKKEKKKELGITESVYDILSEMDESVLDLINPDLSEAYRIMNEASAEQIKSDSEIAKKVKNYLAKYGVKFTWRINKHLEAVEQLYDGKPEDIRLALVAMPYKKVMRTDSVGYGNGIGVYNSTSREELEAEGTRIILFLDDRILVYGKGIITGKKVMSYNLKTIHEVLANTGMVWAKITLKFSDDYHQSELVLGRIHKKAVEPLRKFFNSYSNAHFNETFDDEEVLKEDFEAYSDYDDVLNEKEYKTLHNTDGSKSPYLVDKSNPKVVETPWGEKKTCK